MKTLAIRAAVVVLSLTSLTASTVTSKAAPKKDVLKQVVVGGVGSPPLCMPSDPTYCGLQ